MAVDPSPSSSTGGEQSAPKAPFKDPKKKKDEKKEEDLVILISLSSIYV